MPSNNTKKYKNYTHSDMNNALINIKTRRMTVMNASKTFKIPRRTLYDRIKKTFFLHVDKQQTGFFTPITNEKEKYANIELFMEPEIIIEEKPIIKIDPEIYIQGRRVIEERLKITHEIDILEQQIEDDQIENKSELLRQLFLLKLASK